jgi:hypothetical protein
MALGPSGAPAYRTEHRPVRALAQLPAGTLTAPLLHHATASLGIALDREGRHGGTAIVASSRSPLCWWPVPGRFTRRISARVRLG